jgi:endoglucanase
MHFLKRSLLFASFFLANTLQNVSGYSIDNNGTLLDNTGASMRIKGISWFGLETPDMAPNGMWRHDMSFFMDTLATDQFNVLRVPFSSQWILYHFDDYPDMGFVSADPLNQHKKAIEILDNLMDMAYDRNILILLDLHRLDWRFISELWYDRYNGAFTEESFLTTWFKVLDRYHDHPALWGVDLLNEPHGSAEWGSGNPALDWAKFAEHAIFEIEKRYANATWIYMVEGVGWGKELQNAEKFPITPPASAKNRIAYSPHSYGASVVPSTDMSTWGLHNDWDSHFGNLRAQGYAVIVGEWGGRVDIDAGWMNKFVSYLIEKKMADNFFWSLGPNSGDVAGYLLDDWSTVDEFKRQVTTRLQPNPVPMPRIP